MQRSLSSQTQSTRLLSSQTTSKLGLVLVVADPLTRFGRYFVRNSVSLSLCITLEIFHLIQFVNFDLVGRKRYQPLFSLPLPADNIWNCSIDLSTDQPQSHLPFSSISQPNGPVLQQNRVQHPASNSHTRRELERENGRITIWPLSKETGINFGTLFNEDYLCPGRQNLKRPLFPSDPSISRIRIIFYFLLLLAIRFLFYTHIFLFFIFLPPLLPNDIKSRHTHTHTNTHTRSQAREVCPWP